MRPDAGGGPRNQRTLLAVMVVAAITSVAFAALAVGGVFDSDDGPKPEPTPPPVATTTTPTTAKPTPPPIDRRPIAGRILTVYSSLPLQGASRIQATAIQNGAKLAIAERRDRVGRYRIEYRPLDDSTAASGRADIAQTAANARRAADDRTVVGYIGEYNSTASAISIPILNSAGIAQVSPSNAFVGLTTGEPGAGPGEPEKYYPTGRRTYARILPRDTVQAAALATAASEEGCSSATVWSSGTPYSSGLARSFTRAAGKLGVTVDASATIDPKAPNYRARAAKVSADCFVWTGELESNGAQVLENVGRAKPRTRILAGDGQCFDVKVGVPRRVAKRFKCTIAPLDPVAFGPAGRRFFKRYAKAYPDSPVDPYAIYGHEAMDLLLDSVATASELNRGRVSRRTVVRALLHARSRQSPIGTYSIDRNGDTTLTDYGLYKLVRGKLAFDRVLRPKPGLAD